MIASATRSLGRTVALLLASVCAMLAVPAIASAAPCGPVSDSRPDQASSTVSARTTVCLLNRERRAHGLGKLRLNRRLSAAAKRHTRDMVRRRYFDHVSRGGRDVVDRLRNSGYISRAASWVVGENLAWGSGSRGTPRAIVRSWMHSPGHRRNILTPRFREIGIGIAFATPTRSSSGGGTYTTTFGARG